MKSTLTTLVVTTPLLMTGCAVSGYGTQNDLLFDAQQGDAAPVNKASWLVANGEAVSLKFNCPEQIHSVMMSIIVPLPPVIPAKSENDDHFTAIVSMPKSWQKSPPPLVITLANGQPLSWPAENGSSQPPDDKQALTHYYRFDLQCRLLDGATVTYTPPATDQSDAHSARKLTFTSKKHLGFEYMRS
jgi:hypothetical protein